MLGRNAPSTFIRAVMQPLLFAFVFAYVLPKIGSSFGGGGRSGVTFSTILVVQKITAGAIQAFLGAAIVFPVVYWVHAPGQGPHIDVTNWFLLIDARLRLLPVVRAARDPLAADHVLINPMVCMTEGLRAVLTPSLGHMALWAIMLALVGGTFRNRVVN